MSMLSGTTDFFGLDIGTTAVRLVQLRGDGTAKTLVKYGFAPVQANITQSDAKADQEKLASVIRNLLAESAMTTRDVAVGLPSQKVFTTVVDIEKLESGELAQTIKYQADSLIPTPLAESKYDWALIGDSPKEKDKVEVLLSSVSNEFVENRLDMLESLGLNIIAFEPDTMALTRSVIPSGATTPYVVVDVGSRSTDLVVTMNGAPRLTRSIPTGSEAIIKAAEQNLNIEQAQAHQFVFKFGLSKDKLDGQIYEAVIGTVDILMTEIEKSIKFFESRYPDAKLDRIIVTGSASTIPEFPVYIANKFSINVEIGNAWRNVVFAPERQNELLAVSNQFSVAVGLAERQL